jgi:hypothetical protein
MDVVTHPTCITFSLYATALARAMVGVTYPGPIGGTEIIPPVASIGHRVAVPELYRYILRTAHHRWEQGQYHTEIGGKGTAILGEERKRLREGQEACLLVFRSHPHPPIKMVLRYEVTGYMDSVQRGMYPVEVTGDCPKIGVRVSAEKVTVSLPAHLNRRPSKPSLQGIAFPDTMFGSLPAIPPHNKGVIGRINFVVRALHYRKRHLRLLCF